MLKHGKVYLSNPDTTRDWVYVDDHVNSYLKVLENRKAIGQEIQLATGKCYTTRETAEMIAKKTGFKREII
jgi:nucleoside-diphosphate-sugar epimerase